MYLRSELVLLARTTLLQKQLEHEFAMLDANQGEVTLDIKYYELHE